MRVCPECGKTAIRRYTGIMQASLPPKAEIRWWCGTHGYFGDKEYETEENGNTLAYNRWKKLNG